MAPLFDPAGSEAASAADAPERPAAAGVGSLRVVVRTGLEPFADYSALSHLRRTSGLLGLSPRHFPMDTSRRRALELLANSPNGATNELLVVANGISRDMIAGLVRTRLATVRHETVRAGSEMIGVKRYRITNAGRVALEG